MGASQLWRAITGEDDADVAQAQAQAAQAPDQADHQALYGNAFLGQTLGDLTGDLTGEQALVARSGLKDSIGRAADQVAARAELEGLFDTQNAAPTDGRAFVSDDELDEMVELYSDIRLGNTHLKLDTEGMDEKTAEAFKAGAMGDVAKLMQTESGRNMLRELAYNDKGIDTSIGRQFGDKGPETNGYLGPDRDCSKSNAKDRLGDPNGWCIDDRAHDGSGVDSEVRYRPGVTTTTPDGESRSDVTLYHELAHALHNVRGDQARGAVPSATGDGSYVRNDEFQATGLGKWAYPVDDGGYLVPNENLYRSERRDLGEDLGDRETYGGTRPN